MILTLDGNHDGVTNMARDGDLLARAEKGEVCGRVYGWSSLWVTLGRSQTPESTLVDPATTPWTIRPTGGAAVLHGHDLTVGLAFPLRRSVRGTYRIATAPLVRALRAGGVDAMLAEDAGADRGDPKRIDCFAGSSSNDIVDAASGRKVCGCALRRTHSAVLLQASIPVREPLVEPWSVIREGVLVMPVELDMAAFRNELRLALAHMGAE